MKKHLLSALALAVAMCANATVIQVAPGENTIEAALATAAAGDVLELTTGNYTEWHSQTITTPITIKAAEGATPVVALYKWQFTTDFEMDGLTVSNVSSDNYLLRTGGNVAGTIALKNCTFANQAPTPFLYLSSNTVGTITIDNCIFTGTTKNQGGIIYAGSATVTNFSMTNSTAYNIAGELAVWMGNCTNALVDHCTLYNCGTRPIYIGGTLSSCVVKNCITTMPAAPESNNYCIATYGGTVENCLYYNLNAPRSGATVTGCINADPLFVDAANADFHLGAGSPAIAAATDGTSIGDPRWAPAGETPSEENNNVVMVDLATYQQINTPVTAALANNELTVNYSFDAAWGNGGVKFPLNNLQVVESVDFEYKNVSSTSAESWVSMFVYLEDETGVRWVNEGTLNLKAAADWTSLTGFTVSQGIWGSATTGTIADHQIVAIGFMVNPADACTGSYAIRNVKINLAAGTTPPDVTPTHDLAVDFSAAANVNGTNCSWLLAEGVLDVTYDFSAAEAGSWPNGGVEFPLNNVENVKAMAFDFKGDAAVTQWTSFHAYLKDSEGVRWYSPSKDLHLNGVTDWSHQEFMPNAGLWTTPAHEVGAYPFVAIGFIANSLNPDLAHFYLRDVKVIVEGEDVTTEVEDIQEETKAQKIIRNGQIIIVRDGVEYTLMGARL